ncbi:NUDIX domain-containing protein [Candidatus Nomurabacteria bacterium]|nr:NUDIX domain-containing protein [Candidatus Nomurabacteria bacterium]
MSILDYESQRMLDVVDENDQVIDVVSRIKVHQAGLLHREVHVWMFENDGNLIFQKRGLNRALAGLLDATVGGHMDSGESYADAVLRETREETNLEIPIADLELLKIIRYSDVSENPWDVKNNFFRAIYIYKKTMDCDKIRKEPSVPGMGFQKISLESLDNIGDNEKPMFIPHVLKLEVPFVLTYLKTHDVVNN